MEPRHRSGKVTGREGLVTVIVAAIGAAAGVSSSWITAGRAAEPAAKDAVASQVAQQEGRLSQIGIQLSELEARIESGTVLSGVPIGSIVPSLTAPERFSAASGDAPGFDPRTVTWVPADGRSVAGSKYAAQLGSEVPDLRGIVLRGLNYSEVDLIRTDEYADTEGAARRAGSLQMDAFQGHGHRHEQGDGPDNAAGTFKGVNGNNQYMAGRVQEPSEWRFGPPRVASETRPKNAAVFYYVRIN